MLGRAPRATLSAVLLALAICVKPIALPLLAAALLYLARARCRGRCATPACGCRRRVLFYVAPFFAFGWSRAPFTQRLNAHLVLQGALSFMTVVRLVRDPLAHAGPLVAAGPALGCRPCVLRGAVLAGRGDGGFEDLLAKGSAFVLVVFLTRTWLAEPNVVLILPLALVLTAHGVLERRALTALWVLPLVFTVFNASPLQLLWVAFPGASTRLLADVGTLPACHPRRAPPLSWSCGRSTGWWIVVACLRRRPGAPPAAGGPASEAPA